MWSRRLRIKSIAFVATATTSRTMSTTSAFSSSALLPRRSLIRNTIKMTPIVHHNVASNAAVKRTSITQQYMNFGGEAEGIPRINKSAMKEIIEDVENSSREESGYCIIDVRGKDEIQFTGKLNDVVETLPLPYIAEGALVMDDEDFKEEFGFEKPSLDETIVFSCAAGIRSQHAGQFAKMAGYTDILDYMGGANEWFS